MVAHAMVNNENYFMNMHVELSSNVNYFHVLIFFGLYQFVFYDGLFSMNARLQDGVPPCLFNDKGLACILVDKLSIMTTT
jgi:hypothetical protein